MRRQDNLIMRVDGPFPAPYLMFFLLLLSLSAAAAASMNILISLSRLLRPLVDSNGGVLHGPT